MITMPKKVFRIRVSRFFSSSTPGRQPKRTSAINGRQISFFRCFLSFTASKTLEGSVIRRSLGVSKALS